MKLTTKGTKGTKGTKDVKGCCGTGYRDSHLGKQQHYQIFVCFVFFVVIDFRTGHSTHLRQQALDQRFGLAAVAAAEQVVMVEDVVEVV